MQASPFEILFLLASIKFLISINMIYLLDCLTMTDLINASTFKLTMHYIMWFSLQLYSVGICTAHKVVKIHYYLIEASCEGYTEVVKVAKVDSNITDKVNLIIDYLLALIIMFHIIYFITVGSHCSHQSCQRGSYQHYQDTSGPWCSCGYLKQGSHFV